jgi:phage shock protein PspC (stress-responsive transcriptional regulator)
MKRLLELLKSKRSLLAGAIGGLSDHFGWNRAVARIVGFFVLWGAPYWLGAPTRNAWWISILIYVGLTLIVRKISCSRDRGIARRWRKRFPGGFTVPNNCRQDRSTEPSNAPSQEQREPVVSSGHAPASKTSGDDKLVEEPFGEALSDLEQRLTRLDQRIQKMESAVTDRSFDWDRRLRRP